VGEDWPHYAKGTGSGPASAAGIGRERNRISVQIIIAVMLFKIHSPTYLFKVADSNGLTLIENTFISLLIHLNVRGLLKMVNLTLVRIRKIIGKRNRENLTLKKVLIFSYFDSVRQKKVS
jgi:hypothetical protein